MFGNIIRIHFFFFSIQNIKSNCYVIFLKYFPIIFFRWKIFLFPVIFTSKRFNFVCSLWIFFYFFMIWRDCYSVLKTFVIFFIDEIYCCFFCFLSNQENLHMIHRNSDLFYDIYNTINEDNGRQTHYLSSILTYFDIYF